MDDETGQITNLYYLDRISLDIKLCNVSSRIGFENNFNGFVLYGITYARNSGVKFTFAIHSLVFAKHVGYAIKSLPS